MQFVRLLRQGFLICTGHAGDRSIGAAHVRHGFKLLQGGFYRDYTIGLCRFPIGLHRVLLDYIGSLLDYIGSLLKAY